LIIDSKIIAQYQAPAVGVAWYQYGADRVEVFGIEVFVVFGGESGI
jgi:hypothetical protein